MHPGTRLFREATGLTVVDPLCDVPVIHLEMNLQRNPEETDQEFELRRVLVFRERAETIPPQHQHKIHDPFGVLTLAA